MSLSDIVNKIWDSGKYKVRRPLLILGTSLMILASGCGKGGSDVTGNGGNGGGGGGSGGSSGSTNSSGNVSLVVNSQDFNINVKNTNGSNLSGVVVDGQYNGNGKYQFLAEPPYSYFCESVCYPFNYSSPGIGGEVDGSVSIDLNMMLSSVNPFNFEIKDRVTPYTSPHQNLDFVGTTTASGLYDFYQEHDALFSDKSFLEFIANNSNEPWFTVALKAEQFRETFIENINPVSEVITHIAGFFGLSYDPDAYYLDVYSNDLGVLTHFESETPYCTVKGEVENSSTGYGVSNAIISVLSGPTLGSWFTDNNGNFVMKYLLGGSYYLSFSHTGFITAYRNNYFSAPLPPFYSCPYIGVLLSPESTGPDTTTLVLQPGSEGYDSVVGISYFLNGDSAYYNLNHGDNIHLYIDHFQITSTQENVIHRSYIKYDLNSIPSNAEVIDAKLLLWGGPDLYLDQPDIEVRRVLNSWSEGSITWTNQPSFASSSEYTLYDIDDDYDWDAWIITNLVDKWVSGFYSNYGLVLKLVNENSQYQKYTASSSDYETITPRPKLEIKYVLD